MRHPSCFSLFLSHQLRVLQQLELFVPYSSTSLSGIQETCDSTKIILQPITRLLCMILETNRKKISIFEHWSPFSWLTLHTIKGLFLNITTKFTTSYSMRIAPWKRKQIWAFHSLSYLVVIINYEQDCIQYTISSGSRHRFLISGHRFYLPIVSGYGVPMEWLSFDFL